MALIIGQINAQRSQAAASNLELIIKERNLDILCIQEPYSYKNSVRGFSSPGLKTIQSTGGYPWAAAILKKENFEILILPGISEHILCFQVTTQSLEFYIINVYFQFSKPIRPILDQVDDLLLRLGGKRILILADSNAWSESWFSHETNERGRIMEDFILANDLIIINEPNNTSTCVTPNGESNIDITLSSSNFAAELSDWRVSSECTTSDHNLIMFKISLNKKKENFSTWYQEKIYNLKRADWDKFKEKIRSEFDDNFTENLKDSPDELIKIFNKRLTKCCDASIPIRKNCIGTVPWWNNELNQLRKNARICKKQLLRAKKLNYVSLIPQYNDKYKVARNKYVATIKKFKKNTWKSFVTTEGNRDPWSIIYKIIRHKIKKDIFLSSLKLPSGEFTHSWKETANLLIDKCVPRDEVNSELDIHKDIRARNEKYVNYNLEPDITVDEISNSFNKCKLRKAPGFDNFQFEIFAELWKVNKEVIHCIFNSCLRNAIFPRLWKIAKLKIVLKNVNRDKTILGSYRPIALLPVLGKIFERIIVNRIQMSYKDNKLENDRQFGFRAGRSTEDALVTLKRGTVDSEMKYIMLIFFDIEAAFDNLWWPTIISRLADAGCSSGIIKIVKSYFRNRKMVISSKFNCVTRKMQRGCPQGSVIGPMAWGWCMDSLLDELNAGADSRYTEAIAYADDLAIIVKGNSRVELEVHSSEMLSVFSLWCVKHKLNISVNKTTALILKGKLSRDRLPILKINNDKIKFSNKVKYLGIILDDKLNFVDHAKYLRSKVLNFVMTLRRVTRETWGLRSHIIDILYTAVIIPIVNYGSRFWFNVVQNSHVMRHLMAAQRSMLLLMTRTCRTVSTVAMQVIAGKLPLDLCIVRQALINRIKRNETTYWEEYIFIENDNTQSIIELNRIKDEIKKIENYLYKIWQNRWNSETRGRTTYQFIKDVKFAVENKWFRPNRFCAYFITGYGSINSTLYERGCAEDPVCTLCRLNEVESIDHMLYICPFYREFRYTELFNTENNKFDLICTKEKFNKFMIFSTNVFNKRNKHIFTQESSGSASPGLGTGNVGFDSNG